MSNDDTQKRQDLRRRRGVDVPCEACRAEGVRMYGHGSTWRGGMGTCSYEWDVCDVCWGSGDASRKGFDIRAAEKYWQENLAQQAAKFLMDDIGAVSPVTKAALQEISTELVKLSHGRKARPMFFENLCRYLATRLDKLIGGINE